MIISRRTARPAVPDRIPGGHLQCGGGSVRGGALKDHVVGVLMPRGVQPDISDSQLLVDTLGIPYVVVNIGAAADALEKTLEENEKLQQISSKTEMAPRG